MSKTSSSDHVPDGGPWTVLTVETAVVHEASVVDAAAETLGVEVRPADGDRIEVALFVESPARAREVEVALRRALPPGAVLSWQVDSVPDGRWVERYQASLGPIDLGERFVVVPSGVEVPADRGRETIRLTPGRAFGTGEHPTTRMCVVHLERLVRAGERWLDVGTGSGILAVVAARCGAGEVLGTDIDDDALAVAGDVVRDNGVEGSVALGRAGAERSGVPYDGVVVNVSLAYLAEEAAALGELARGATVLIASGVLAEESDTAVTAIERGGWRVERVVRDGEWVSIVARRPVPGAHADPR